MRILHTADWHAGKKLGRIDRSTEFEQVFDELVAIARDEKVDAVVIAGDLFDRAAAPLDSIALVVDTLMRLADEGRKVIAIPGNHDSPQLFEILGRLLENRGVLLSSRIKRPDEGGVIAVSSRDGSETLSIGLFPFLHEAQVVDFMKEEQDWFKGYADRIRLISNALAQRFDPKGVGMIVGHWFVENAELGGGERKIHLGQQYAATSHSVPPTAAYVALGHIHKPQAIAGSVIPSRYSGSLLSLDFSERDYKKEVVIADLSGGRPAKVKSVHLSAGRKLLRIEGTMDDLASRASEFQDSYLDVRVKTEGPVLGLAQQVREILGNDVVLVQALWERTTAPLTVDTDSKSITDRYADYHASATGHGVEAPPVLLDLLREIEHEVLSETA